MSLLLSQCCRVAPGPQCFRGRGRICVSFEIYGTEAFLTVSYSACYSSHWLVHHWRDGAGGQVCPRPPEPVSSLGWRQARGRGNRPGRVLHRRPEELSTQLAQQTARSQSAFTLHLKFGGKCLVSLSECWIESPPTLSSWSSSNSLCATHAHKQKTKQKMKQKNPFRLLRTCTWKPERDF